MEVRRYCSSDGTDEFGTWLGSLADARAKAAILVRIARIGLGNLGDFKPVGNGVRRFGSITAPATACIAPG
jgi:putative addiction module killer protein